MKCTNDVSWYTHFGQMSRDVASIFMSRPAGQGYPDRDLSNYVVGSMFTQGNDALSRQGGIFIMNVIPTWGGTVVPGGGVSNAAINSVASRLYYYVVHGNSRNVSYDKSDLVKVMMAMDSIRMIITEAQRVYKLISAVSIENYWTKRLVAALGWDPNDLMSHIAEFRAKINMASQRFNYLYFPMLFDIFHAHEEPFKWVYRDRPGVKSQYMACVSDGAWIYTDEMASLALFSSGKLNGNDVNWCVDSDTRPLRTVADFWNLVSYMLHCLEDSTDVGVIKGDLRMAFPDSNLMTCDIISDTYMGDDLPIIFDEEFNLKLHNVEFPLYGLADEEITVTTDPAETKYNARGYYQDDGNVTGNLRNIFLAPVGVYPNLRSSTCWANGQHIMDLPDGLTADVGNVTLMHAFKTAGAVSAPIPGMYAHVQINTMAFLPVNWIYWTADPSHTNLATYLKARHNMVYVISGSGSFSTDMANETIQALKLTELAVSLPIQLCVNNGTGIRPIGDLYQCENITLYDDSVAGNVIHAAIESLFYNEKFYNASIS